MGSLVGAGTFLGDAVCDTLQSVCNVRCVGTFATYGGACKLAVCQVVALLPLALNVILFLPSSPPLPPYLPPFPSLPSLPPSLPPSLSLPLPPSPSLLLLFPFSLPPPSTLRLVARCPATSSSGGSLRTSLPSTWMVSLHPPRAVPNLPHDLSTVHCQCGGGYTHGVQRGSSYE